MAPSKQRAFQDDRHIGASFSSFIETEKSGTLSPYFLSFRFSLFRGKERVPVAEKKAAPFQVLTDLLLIRLKSDLGSAACCLQSSSRLSSCTAADMERT